LAATGNPSNWSIPYKLQPLSDQGGIFPGNPGKIGGVDFKREMDVAAKAWTRIPLPSEKETP